MSQNDRLITIAREHWIDEQRFDIKVLKELYEARYEYDIKYLEQTHCLEKFLWENLDIGGDISWEHLFLIVLIVNQKFVVGMTYNFWDNLLSDKNSQKKFNVLFDSLLSNYPSISTPRDSTNVIIFLIHCFESLENEYVRSSCLKIVSLPIWTALHSSKLKFELSQNPSVHKLWKKLQKKLNDDSTKLVRTFLPDLLKQFVNVIQSENEESISYAERVLELIITLLSQISTRKFLRPLLEDFQVTTYCELSPIVTTRLPKQLEMMKFFLRYEVNETTGETGSVIDIHTQRLQTLQRTAFKFFGDSLRELALANVKALESRENLEQWFSKLTARQLRDLCVKLKLLEPIDNMETDSDEDTPESKEHLVMLLASTHTYPPSPLRSISSAPATETQIWDKLPAEYDGGSYGIWKMTLQNVCVEDYLVRNYELYRLEQNFRIRERLEEIITAVNARVNPTNMATSFTATHPAALPITLLQITSITPPKLGQLYPARVEAEATVDTIWEECQVALVSIATELRVGQQPDETKPFPERYGVKYVRLARVLRTEDESGVLHNIETDEDFEASNTARRLILELDSKQYIEDGVEIYERFNLIIKIHDLWKMEFSDNQHDVLGKYAHIQPWLRDCYLGYGELMGEAESVHKCFDFHDTFLSSEHLLESFPDKKIKFVVDENSEINPPYKITFREVDEETSLVEVEPYDRDSHTPFEIPKINQIRYTAEQIEAIVLAMCNGLTVVTGPTGTGKTEVAVQIVSNLYWNFNKEKTLVLVKTNAALEDFMYKLMERDIQGSHVVCLTQSSTTPLLDYYSKMGRVNYMLQRRQDLLQVVDRLAQSLGINQHVGATCESATYFFLSQITSRWEAFKQKCMHDKSSDAVLRNFFLTDFFNTHLVHKTLFKGSFSEDYKSATECYQYLKKLFSELAQYRPLEIIRGTEERCKFVVTMSKIVVAEIGQVKNFEEYDNIVIEEAHSMLQLETLFHGPLKRLILIGDETAPPAIVRNGTLKHFSHLDVSFFHRLCKLDLAKQAVRLNSQGRMRPSLAKIVSLFESSLPHTKLFSTHNAGFEFDHQVINVGDYLGKGEMQPRKKAWVNLGEAEYVVAVYMYMRLIGYPKDRITIMTTHESQRDLINDVLDRRCSNPLFSIPRVVTVNSTENNDYVLLSLVRTTDAQHFRHIRTHHHALTRARLALYVFCRSDIYEKVPELEEIWTRFGETRDLSLCVKEKFGDVERSKETMRVRNVVEMGRFVHELTQEKVMQFKKQQDMDIDQ